MIWAVLRGSLLQRSMGRIPEPGATGQGNGGANYWYLCQDVRWAELGEAPSPAAGGESSVAGS